MAITFPKRGVRFLYYSNKETLVNDISNNSVVETDIVFLNDTVEGTLIWTHGEFFSLSETEFKNFLDRYSAEDIVMGSYIKDENGGEIDGLDSINTAIAKLDANIDCKAEKIPISYMTNTTATLLPNILYVWGEVASLDISFSEGFSPTTVNEYIIQFTSGETPTTLSLPANINWAEELTEIEANKSYIIAVKNGLGIFGIFGKIELPDNLFPSVEDSGSDTTPPTDEFD